MSFRPKCEFLPKHFGTYRNRNPFQLTTTSNRPGRLSLASLAMTIFLNCSRLIMGKHALSCLLVQASSLTVTPLTGTQEEAPPFQWHFLSPQLDLHTIKMSGYSDTVRSSQLTVTLFCHPSTVTVSGEACNRCSKNAESCLLYGYDWLDIPLQLFPCYDVGSPCELWESL